jgi:hypothetical protein
MNSDVLVIALALVLALQLVILVRLGRVPRRTQEEILLALAVRFDIEPGALQKRATKRVDGIVASLEKLYGSALYRNGEDIKLREAAVAQARDVAREQDMQVHNALALVNAAREMVHEVKLLARPEPPDTGRTRVPELLPPPLPRSAPAPASDEPEEET